MSNSTFVLNPIPSSTAEVLRAAGGAINVADSKPGYPCRQCLRDAEIGEELVLVSHDPFGPDLETPYRSASPIFLHRETCTPPGDLSAVPEQLAVRQLSVRSFDDTGHMIDAAVIAGTDLDATIVEFFADQAATSLHVHNAHRGCWATSIVRG